MTSHVTKEYVTIRSSVNVLFPKDLKFNKTVKKMKMKKGYLRLEGMQELTEAKLANFSRDPNSTIS